MAQQPLLKMVGVRKTFGPVVALDNVSLELNKNEIHGFLGGNGAGKTTLMNVLYGLYKPDAGEIYLDGQKIDIRSPKDAIAHGIGMVHQHFLQIENYTVTENIVLGTELQNRPTLKLDEAEKRIADLSERFGLVVDPRAVIENLPMGVRQRVEILKALYRGVRILILDEPTTNLTPQEVDALFESLRVMVNQGLSVVFITHKLREVMSVCDRISVLRNGRNAISLPRSEANEEILVREMVGEGLDVEKSLLFSGEGLGKKTLPVGEKVVLHVENLTVRDENGLPVVNDVSFDVHEQEILGLAGVAGNGQQELAESLLGIRPIAAGRVVINGTDVAQTGTRQLIEQGVTYIPQDRLNDGFLPRASVAQNLILGYHRQPPYSSKNGLLNWPAIYQTARRLIKEYTIKTTGPDEIGANLSGGNIQRVMLARAFSHQARLMIAHNPTRGLDIHSMEFVYTKLLEQKEQGLATLLISEDLDELMLLCNRIAVMYRGQIMGILDRSQFDKYQIGRLMSGVKIND
ncbi:MAG: ABC transporter ATP-binding protein [Chloroflexi bacterium]|nr:MAG: ABC transporter ATP-binding protein [Chloroflexota bacterium]